MSLFGQIHIIINSRMTITVIIIFSTATAVPLHHSMHYNMHHYLPLCYRLCLYRHRETTRPYIIRHITNRCRSGREIELAHTRTLSWAAAIRKKIDEKISRTRAAAVEDRQIGGKTSCGFSRSVLYLPTIAADYHEKKSNQYLSFKVFR